MRETLSFSPEVNLVITCARLELQSVHQEQIRYIVELGLDWHRVWNLALAHGMLPLLYWHLHRMNLPDIPAWFYEQLRENFKENAARNLYRTKELVKIVTAFEQKRVPLIAYKGIMLSEILYGNVSLRQFNDLDLYVNKTNFHLALEILKSCGYQNYFLEQASRRDAYLQFGGECVFMKTSGRESVDLHWLITPPELHLWDFETQIWERLYIINFAGCMMHTVSLPDLMFVLCLHGSRSNHIWCRLNWICDLAELSKHLSTQDWQLLFDRARYWHVENMIKLGLFLVDDLLRADLPDFVREQFYQNQKFLSLSKHIYARMFQGAGIQPGYLESALFYSRVSSTLGEGLMFTLRQIFTPTYVDWEAVTLPLWLYYFYRPLRLLKKHILIK